MHFLDFFTDPVLRGPTFGTFFMCIASSLTGVILILKKRSLLSETISHAAYPGIIVGASLFATLFPDQIEMAFFGVLLGAFGSSLLGFKTIDWMEKKGKVRPDTTLCFVLALFLGIGTLFASAMQYLFPSWRTTAQSLLFGQAATMNDFHILLYAILTALVIGFLFITFRPLQALLFDSDHAKISGIGTKWLERILFWVILFSIILGIRSVGIVLMSGMAIAPAIAARQFTDRLQSFFVLSALFGALSGLMGNILSVKGTIAMKMTLPTGPMILLTAALLALLSLLFAPRRGLLSRMQRIASFRFRCLKENVLKSIWKKGSSSFQELKKTHTLSAWTLLALLWRLKRGGWIQTEQERIILTSDGYRKASSIVRLHRLWELYLASELGLSKEKIHPNAEEMEHILTPEIEERLTELLSDPKVDPHHQPIPEKNLL